MRRCTSFLFAAGLLLAAVAAEARLVTVLLELEREPAAALNREGDTKGGPSATRRRVAEIEADQAAVLRAVRAKSADTRVLFAVQRVYNGVALQTRAGRLEDLAALPGVRAVHTLRRHYLANETSMPFIGAPAAWEHAGLPLTGAGVTIGIIDTGIDYRHPAFGGNAGSVFPTMKVVGGHDFVGDAYDADDPVFSVPVPDADPMDQNGHGTHVAGTAGGFGVTLAGDPYAGPYGAGTDYAGLLIGPGAAPDALLHAIKVFGKGRASYFVLPGIEYAVDPDGDGDLSDRLDVVNLSLGDLYGSDMTPEAQAAMNAAAAGVVVVAAAGNGGDVYFIHSSPGVAPAAIAVAASEDDDPAFGAAMSPDRMTAFSSRGPAGLSTGIVGKPDVSAPGLNIRSAKLFDSSRPTERASLSSGTSMATPHVAGLAALLREQRPAWTPAEIKAAIMNTATHDVFHFANFTLPRVTTSRAGAGRVDAAKAVENRVIAYDAAHPERVGITFAVRDVEASVVERRTIRVENKSGATVAYTLGLDTVTDLPAMHRFLAPESTGPIPPGGFADIEFGIQTGLQNKHPRDPALRTGVNEYTRHWISEFSGFVTLTPQVGAVHALRLPFYATLRLVSALAGPDQIDLRETGTGEVTLAGRAAITGPDAPFDFVSLATPLELVGESPRNTLLPHPENGGDLRYVGVTSDYTAAEEPEDAMVYFGIATWADWWTPGLFQFVIDIDTTGGGESNFALYSSVNPLDSDPSGGFVSDVFVSRLHDFATDTDTVQGLVNHFGADEFDTALFGNNVIVLPAKAADLGLAPGATQLTFQVRAEFVNADPGAELVDEAGPFTYDIAAPGLDFTGGEPGYPAIIAMNGASFPVAYDGEAFAARGLGLLVFHHHNAQGERAQVIQVVTEDPLPDPPPAAQGVAASDGEFADFVRVTWEAGAPETEYRVYRALDGTLAAAVPVSEWMTGATFDDTTATAARQTDPGACEKPVTVHTVHTYWVLTRNAGGEGEFSAPDEGYRGLRDAAPAGVFLFGGLAAVLVWRARRRRPLQSRPVTG